MVAICVEVFFKVPNQNLVLGSISTQLIDVLVPKLVKTNKKMGKLLIEKCLPITEPSKMKLVAIVGLF